MTLRRRLIALAGAAVGLPVSGCSAPPTAHRADRTEETAVTAPTVAPDSRPGSDDGPTTSTTGPAPTTTTEAPTTTHVVTVPTDPPTTIVVRPRPLPATTLPELVDDDLSDEEWWAGQRMQPPPNYIKQCESGGNYQAVNPNGHYGAWQFSLSTWRSVGGTGRPDQASPAEQDYRAALLWDNGRGASHWACA